MATPATRRRVLVVSHPAVLAVNRLVYAELAQLGWDPWIVVPSRWRHEYAAGPIAPERGDEPDGRVIASPVLFAGRVQRHLYLTRASRVIGDVKPQVAFVEAEPTAVPALQWGRALQRARVPFGLQVDENLDRDLPVIARLIRGWSEQHAAFAAARSPAAARLLAQRAPSLPTPLIPHHIAAWPPSGARLARDEFTIGYAGRFTREKGLEDLLAAAARVQGARLRLVGNGPLLDELRARARRGAAIDIVTEASHAWMNQEYARMDVLVLPSRTTDAWAEQFGRVLVEALWCGVPVVGSSSGEIPWVIETTGGGVVFPEGDAEALGAALVALRDDPQRRAELARAGRASVAERFTAPAVARVLSAALEAALDQARR